MGIDFQHAGIFVVALFHDPAHFPLRQIAFGMGGQLDEDFIPGKGAFQPAAQDKDLLAVLQNSETVGFMEAGDSRGNQPQGLHRQVAAVAFGNRAVRQAPGQSRLEFFGVPFLDLAFFL